jgi:hypothetical protein
MPRPGRTGELANEPAVGGDEHGLEALGGSDIERVVKTHLRRQSQLESLVEKLLERDQEQTPGQVNAGCVELATIDRAVVQTPHQHLSNLAEDMIRRGERAGAVTTS